MAAQLYTLSEVLEALRWMSEDEDSLSTILKAGDFRQKFETFIADCRAERDRGRVSTLSQRLVTTIHNNHEVYILDDIQDALTKKQFAAFMKFIQSHHIYVNVDETTYIPTELVNPFIRSDPSLSSLVDDEAADLKFA